MFSHFTDADHKYFMSQAYDMRKFSHDRRTQTGAVVVNRDKFTIGSGTNKLPMDITNKNIKPFRDAEHLKFFNSKYGTNITPEQIKKPEDFIVNVLNTDFKYSAFQHAERGAIAMAAKNGHATNDCAMYATFYPCIPCANLIIEAGIKLLVVDNEPDYTNERWKKQWGIDWKTVETLLKANNIKTLFMRTSR